MNDFILILNILRTGGLYSKTCTHTSTSAQSMDSVRVLLLNSVYASLASLDDAVLDVLMMAE